MNEFEPEPDEFYLNISDGTEYLATRYNTTLFTFFGKLATRNHVFFETAENDDGTISGFYIFAHANIYQAILERVAEFDFPMELNKLQVPDCDEAAFQKSIDQLTGEVEDYIPEDFYEG